MTQVVLVRPWTDARAGGGCCGGEVRDGLTVQRLASEHRLDCDAADPVGRAWRVLHAERPEVDVQVVDAGNPWLAVTVFRAVRPRAGVGAAIRAAARSGAAGSVHVDGVRVGDLEELGPAGVLAAAGGPRRR